MCKLLWLVPPYGRRSVSPSLTMAWSVRPFNTYCTVRTLFCPGARSIGRPIDVQIVLAGSAVRQTQRVALVDHNLVRPAVQRILHREGFGLVGSWISTHGLIAYFEAKLSSVDLRVQAR